MAEEVSFSTWCDGKDTWCYEFPLSFLAYYTIINSHRTYGLMTHYAYLYSESFSIAVAFSVQYLLSDDASPLYL